ncbi:MFS transporter, partial [Burkholderia cenocepacia]|nr:MFS transporter [Burkholderia cenocepacia]
MSHACGQPNPFIEPADAGAFVTRDAESTRRFNRYATDSRKEPEVNATDTLDPASAEEQRIMSKMARRLLPILVVMFLIA